MLRRSRHLARAPRRHVGPSRSSWSARANLGRPLSLKRSPAILHIGRVDTKPQARAPYPPSRRSKLTQINCWKAALGPIFGVEWSSSGEQSAPAVTTAMSGCLLLLMLCGSSHHSHVASRDPAPSSETGRCCCPSGFLVRTTPEGLPRTSTQGSVPDYVTRGTATRRGYRRRPETATERTRN